MPPRVILLIVYLSKGLLIDINSCSCYASVPIWNFSTLSLILSHVFCFSLSTSSPSFSLCLPFSSIPGYSPLIACVLPLFLFPFCLLIYIPVLSPSLLSLFNSAAHFKQTTGIKELKASKKHQHHESCRFQVAAGSCFNKKDPSTHLSIFWDLLEPIPAVRGRESFI